MEKEEIAELYDKEESNAGQRNKYLKSNHHHRGFEKKRFFHKQIPVVDFVIHFRIKEVYLQFKIFFDFYLFCLSFFSSQYSEKIIAFLLIYSTIVIKVQSTPVNWKENRSTTMPARDKKLWNFAPDLQEVLLSYSF